jgi:predicted Zn-dependent peptidase
MIKYKRFELDNGLKLLVNEDDSTPMVSVCTTYNVGTKDEQEGKSGFAHLFEHLMFGGSENAPDFDHYIQKAGGENNAFTNQDMTVYYEYLPCENIEVALWLEADRMQGLQLNQPNLSKERKVVLEEFKESCLNEPYGDIWHHIGPLTYLKHPYRIPTIGERPEHIEQANLEDVQSFYQNFYCPNNAVLSVSGKVEAKEVFELCKKWFGDVATGKAQKAKSVVEPRQTNRRQKTVQSNVPLDALYMVFHSAERRDDNYYIDDIITDILAEGEASILYEKLVKELELFSFVDAYITGSIDAGLLVIEGKLGQGVSFEQAEASIWELLEQLILKAISSKELEKIQHRIEHNLEFSEMSNLHKAISLGYYEILGDVDLMNREKDKYQAISAVNIQKRSRVKTKIYEP